MFLFSIILEKCFTYVVVTINYLNFNFYSNESILKAIPCLPITYCNNNSKKIVLSLEDCSFEQLILKFVKNCKKIKKRVCVPKIVFNNNNIIIPVEFYGPRDGKISCIK